MKKREFLQVEEEHVLPECTLDSVLSSDFSSNTNGPSRAEECCAAALAGLIVQQVGVARLTEASAEQGLAVAEAVA